MVDEHTHGGVGEIDTLEEFDAVEAYVEKRLRYDATILVVMSFLLLAAGGWVIAYPDTSRKIWGSLPWPDVRFTAPILIQQSAP